MERYPADGRVREHVAEVLAQQALAAWPDLSQTEQHGRQDVAGVEHALVRSCEQMKPERTESPWRTEVTTLPFYDPPELSQQQHTTVDADQRIGGTYLEGSCQRSSIQFRELDGVGAIR